MLEEKTYKMIDGKYITSAIVMINERGDILGCHTTGRDKYDFPKGMVEINETDVEGAARELMEETGLKICDVETTGKRWNYFENLIDCGIHPHGKSEKYIHIFLYRTPFFPDLNDLKCTSFFEIDGRRYPEVDGYSIIKKNERFKFNRILHSKFDMIDKINKTLTE